MVRGIMGQVVDQVADHKSGDEWIDPLRGIKKNTCNQIEQPIENECHGDAHRRRHNQASLALRLGVMNSVKEEYQAL